MNEITIPDTGYETFTTDTTSGPMKVEYASLTEIAVLRHEFERTGNIFLSASMHGVTDVKMGRTLKRKTDTGMEYRVRKLKVVLDNGAEFEMNLFLEDNES